jgi:nitrogen fixation protein NifU and related proteins
MGELVYSTVILDHFRHPRNAGETAGFEWKGEASNPLCGDRVRIGYRLSEGRIEDIRFHAEACAICTASASVLTVLVRGSTPREAVAVTAQELTRLLDASIPQERQRCATLPLEALKAATMPPGGNRTNDPEVR